ncbi:MAG: type II toxin-antitoxin system HigB family toxin [Bacteroidales bacterium]|nr:type II toxin-antitoxin system HigB family toxin [Bacteroidales bacterium]
MRLLGKPKLEKLKRKNKGNKKLIDSIERLIIDIEENNWSNQLEVKESRPDADCIHSDGFYFFNINVHRTIILIEFDDGEATVVWVGTHSQYETTFKNNKAIIEKWLRANEYID